MRANERQFSLQPFVVFRENSASPVQARYGTSFAGAVACHVHQSGICYTRCRVVHGAPLSCGGLKESVPVFSFISSPLLSFLGIPAPYDVSKIMRFPPVAQNAANKTRKLKFKNQLPFLKDFSLSLQVKANQTVLRSEMYVGACCVP